MKKFLSIAFVLLVASSSFAQKASTGFIYEDTIFDKYNNVKKLDEDVKKKQETFETEFNKIALEYQNANLAYQESLKNITNETSESINSKLKKVQEIKESAENYQREIEKEIQEYIGTNIIEIKKQIQEASQKVAKQKGVTYVFTRNQSDTPMNFSRIVLSTDESKTLNLTEDVIKLLNSSSK